MLDIAAPTINQSSLSTGFFGGLQDTLSFGLESWMQVEQINQLKNAGGSSQRDLAETIEVPTPQVVEVPANQQIAEKFAQGLQIGTGTLAAVVGGVALLWFLTKK